MVVVVVLLFTYAGQAQTFWTIANASTISAKAAIGTALGAEATQLGLLTAGYKELTKTEKALDDRKSGAKEFLDPKNSFMIAATLYSIETTEDAITDLQTEVEEIKASHVHFKHRLNAIEGELETEKKYLDEIQEDYIWLGAGAVLGGGVGYTYTAFLKVLLRSMKIRRRVMVIRKEVNNLNTNNKIFKRKAI